VRAWTLLSVLALLLGAALRAIQYAAQSSLWVDEAALARNIVNRQLDALVLPLDFAQYAPVGFLVVQKMVAGLGTSELFLRAVPFVSSLIAMWLFAQLSQRLLSKAASAMAIVMFSLGSAFIYFGAQAKQYSSDVAITLALLLVALRAVREGRTRWSWAVLGLGGAAACLFSYPAALVLSALVTALVVLKVLERNAMATAGLLTVAGCSFAGVVAAAIVARQSIAAEDLTYARQVWAAWFAPWPPRTIGDIAWPWHKLVEAFGLSPYAPPRLDAGLRYAAPACYAALALLGFVGWLRRGAYDAALFVGIPLIGAAAASALHLYPIGGRVSLYLLPLPILAAAEGWSLVCGLLRLSERGRAVAAGAALVAPVSAIAANLPPFYLEHMRPVLEQVRREWQPGDHIYVYYGAGQAFLFYAPRLGFSPADYTVGSCSLAAPRGYFEQLKRFTGRSRVWAVFAHSTSNGAELIVIRDHLDRVGRRLRSVEVPAAGAHAGAGAYAYLYDLAAPRAEEIDDPPPIDLWPLACYGTMSPE
jgi:hypothetical protein